MTCSTLLKYIAVNNRIKIIYGKETITRNYMKDIKFLFQHKGSVSYSIVLNK